MIDTTMSALADGCQVLAHDAYDAATFAQATEDYGRLGRMVEESGATLQTAPALLRDLFWSFHQHTPHLAMASQCIPRMNSTNRSSDKCWRRANGMNCA